MQSLGTEWGRECIDENIWTNLWWEVAGLHIRLGKSVVVDDLRLLNEAEVIKLHGGQIWRVDRDGTGHDLHSSETSIMSITADVELLNDRTLKVLARDVDAIISLPEPQSVSSNVHTT